MIKKRSVEVGVVLLVIAAALTYQLIYTQAERAEVIDHPFPGLPEQTFSANTIITEEADDHRADAIAKQQRVRDYISSLSAPGLRKYNPHISLLGDSPDWAALDGYQRTISKADFLHLLTEVYTIGSYWKDWIEVHDDYALITQSAGDQQIEKYRLEFISESTASPPRPWRAAVELGGFTNNRPLAGILIAIDPGHIGGEQWALIEERDFAIGKDKPVREGELTLKVAKLLKPQLESLGAEVVFVRETLEPINPKRPGHYEYDARVELVARGQVPSVPLVDDLKNKMFYRVDEIRERAKIVNQVIRPDMVICLHFNATSWGDPDNRRLTKERHLHLILHGAFTKGEVAKDDERFSLVEKILMGNHQEEAMLAEKLATSMAKATKLPPFLYPQGNGRARKINNNDYLWARNLLANRLYRCPVVYLEPYVMNDRRDYSRIQLGDYEGVKMVNGEERISIFKEYAQGVVDGLKNYYSEVRAPLPMNETSSEEDE